MAVWLAVSIKRGERNIVLPITVECEPDETFMDLLEKVMAQSTSELPPLDVDRICKDFFLCPFFNSSFQNSLSQINFFPRSFTCFVKGV